MITADVGRVFSGILAHYRTSSYSPAFFVLVPTQGIYIGNIGIFSFLQGSTLGMSTLSDYIYRHIDTTGDH
jgi:hypothetical protein